MQDRVLRFNSGGRPLMSFCNEAHPEMGNFVNFKKVKFQMNMNWQHSIIKACSKFFHNTAKNCLARRASIESISKAFCLRIN